MNIMNNNVNAVNGKKRKGAKAAGGSSNKRKINTTDQENSVDDAVTKQANSKQRTELINFMKDRTAFAERKLSNTLTYDQFMKTWEELKELLNLYGPEKNVQGWTKYWNDLKSRTKRKALRILNRKDLTGGGLDANLELLTKEEQTIIDIIGGEVAVKGDKSVSEAGVPKIVKGISKEVVGVEVERFDASAIEPTEDFFASIHSYASIPPKTPSPTTQNSAEINYTSNLTPTSTKTFASKNGGNAAAPSNSHSFAHALNQIPSPTETHISNNGDNAAVPPNPLPSTTPINAAVPSNSLPPTTPISAISQKSNGTKTTTTPSEDPKEKKKKKRKCVDTTQKASELQNKLLQQQESFQQQFLNELVKLNTSLGKIASDLHDIKNALCIENDSIVVIE